MPPRLIGDPFRLGQGSRFWFTARLGKGVGQRRKATLSSDMQGTRVLVTAIQDVTILAMASLAETRDSDTGNHIRRTQLYV